ncbi:MAG: FtsX-like permease family protein [Paucibacter sp.]|nr:FtsX-like permease family protein [Roseateles sp.]
MDLLPILSTLKRHKTAAGLIVVQIALTCAIVCNALFLISERISNIYWPSHMAENELVVLSISGMKRDENPDPQTKTDLAALRAIPGVRSVTLVNQMPFGDNSNNTGVRLSSERDAKSVSATMYVAGEQVIETLGLRIREGRDFLPEEYVYENVVDKVDNPDIPAVLVNRALAEQLFPGESALGKAIYTFSNNPHRIVGVLEDLIHTHPDPGNHNRPTMILPVRPAYNGGAFMLRTDPANTDAVLKAAKETLVKSGGGLKRLVRYEKTMKEMRADYYQQDRSMVWLLAGVCFGLLVVTAFGIVGLASFWVQQRTRMIGTRRALGATQGQILRYFQTENFLLSTVGIVLGMVMAYGISVLLMREYELPRLPLYYLPVGALTLWLLGQIAVWAPARRAALLPPVAALRSAI